MAALAAKEDDLNEFFAMIPTQEMTPELVLALKVSVRRVWNECKQAVKRFLTTRLKTENTNRGHDIEEETCPIGNLF